MTAQFLRLAIPAIFSSLFLILQESINIIFVAELNSVHKIAGVGVGNSIQNILGVSVFIGMNGALNT
jgi:Na+-driven multidrug efflux pump